MSFVFTTRRNDGARTGRAVWWCGTALLAVLLASGAQEARAAGEDAPPTEAPLLDGSEFLSMEIVTTRAD